jgi:hypothetical protein
MRANLKKEEEEGDKEADIEDSPMGLLHSAGR